MLVDGIPIRTRGSVGIADDSISLIAHMTIPPEWVENTPALVGLAGEVLPLPITGTTARPQLDRRALSHVTSQLARAAARSYLQHEVGSKLQRTLGDKLPGILGDSLPTLLGAPDRREPSGDVRQDIGRSLQTELGNQLNRLFK